MKTYTTLQHEMDEARRYARVRNISADQIKIDVREDTLENIILANEKKYDMSDPKVRKSIVAGLKEAISIVIGMRG